ncbi:uncharacterized mitochondrial protein-like protein [Tanacetum coccineum]
MTLAQFGKKRDKNATLQVFDQVVVLQCVETASEFTLTSSMFKGDGVTMICDDVKVADMKKPIDRTLATPYNVYDDCKTSRGFAKFRYQYTHSSLIKTIKGHLNDKFRIKDLGPLHYYLGIKFLRNTKGLAMTQRKYAIELVTHAGLLDTKPLATSMDPTIKLTMDTGDPISDPTIYRTLVGKLLYLTITRPDISFPAQTLSQFLQPLTNLHMNALLKVIRYVKLSLTQDLSFL